MSILINGRMFWRRIIILIIVSLMAVISASCDKRIPESPEPEAAILPGPDKFSIAMNGQSIEIGWEPVEGAAFYDVFRAGSRLGKYTFLKTVEKAFYTDTGPNPVKYENYYLISARNNTGKIEEMIISFELKMFGANIRFYDIKYDAISGIEADVNRIHDREMFGNVMDNNGRNGEFSGKRYALYFKPGEYRDFEKFKIGFYTHAAGLGRVPEETKLFGSIETPPHLQYNNATCTFWRSIENFEISGYGVFRWGVSQAAPVRRMKVNVPAVFDWHNGWASGGYSGDCYFADTSGSWSQQQWYSRNSHHSSGLFGVNWNKFVQGATGVAADDNWAEGGSVTRMETTPVIREKPFLFYENGGYRVFVPALRRGAVGVSWTAQDMGSGYSLDIEKDFYIAIAGIDTSDTINTALENGKHIFFTPGIYELGSPIHIKKAGTVVLGTGLATLVPGPENTSGAVIVDDIDNVTVAGLLLDAHYSSAWLLCAGGTANNDHSSSPTLLADIFLRVGGYKIENVHVDAAAIINSNDVIVDHFWVWRADHGRGIGWDKNTSRNGLIVTGDNVTFYGLFVEHFQEYQTLWIGENGRTYFYQSESPYDPFSQGVYLSHNGTVDGWASYKVANSVKDHFAAGLGVYAVFNRTGIARNKSESVFMENAIEVPDKPGVVIVHACIIDLSGDRGVATGIRSVVNGAGPGVRAGTGGQNARREYIVSYSNGIAITRSGSNTGVQRGDEVFILPSNLP
jgi:hypothetical protein